MFKTYFKKIYTYKYKYIYERICFILNNNYKIHRDPYRQLRKL